MSTPTKLLILLAATAFTACQSSAPSKNSDEPTENAQVSEVEAQDDTEKDETSPATDESSEFTHDPELTDEWDKGDAYTGRVEISGHLRFSWLTVETESGTQERELVMRFFADEESRELLPEGPIAEAREMPPVLSLYAEREPAEMPEYDLEYIELHDHDHSFMLDMIDEEFEEVPDNFLTYEEGHVQQPGVLVMEDFLIETMADQPYFFSGFVSFEPTSMDANPEQLQAQLDAQANAAGSQHGPAYEETFFFTNDATIYTEADEESEMLTDAEAQERVRKIRTIDDEWMKVSLENDEIIRGFIRIDAVERVN